MDRVKAIKEYNRARLINTRVRTKLYAQRGYIQPHGLVSTGRIKRLIDGKSELVASNILSQAMVAAFEESHCLFWRRS